MVRIVFFSPRIPQNTGSAIRLSAVTGAELHLVEPLGFDLSEPKLRRAGLDYWQHLDWEAVDEWSALLGRLPGCRPWLFTKHGTTMYTNAAFSSGDVLVFGSESQGLPHWLLEAHPDRCLRIPMAAEARSLNLAVSVAVAAFEARRRVLATDLGPPSIG